MRRGTCHTVESARAVSLTPPQRRALKALRLAELREPAEPTGLPRDVSVGHAGVALARMGLVRRIGPRVDSVGTRHIGYCLTEAGRAAAEGLR